MPLTAYSILAQKKEDVGQVLQRLSTQFGESITAVEAVFAGVDWPWSSAELG
jgi:hypothetical protein